METTEQNVVNETTETAPVVENVVAAPVRKRASASKPKKAKSEKQTKADQARAIYKRFSRGKTVNRAKVIELFMSEVKLSKNGASTYFQKIKNEFRTKEGA